MESLEAGLKLTTLWSLDVELGWEEVGTKETVHLGCGKTGHFLSGEGHRPWVLRDRGIVSSGWGITPWGFLSFSMLF